MILNVAVCSIVFAQKSAQVWAQGRPFPRSTISKGQLKLCQFYVTSPDGCRFKEISVFQHTYG